MRNSLSHKHLCMYRDDVDGWFDVRNWFSLNRNKIVWLPLDVPFPNWMSVDAPSHSIEWINFICSFSSYPHLLRWLFRFVLRLATRKSTVLFSHSDNEQRMKRLKMRQIRDRHQMLNNYHYCESIKWFMSRNCLFSSVFCLLLSNI